EDPLLQPWSWGNVLALETNVAFGEHTATVLAQYYYTENPQAPDNQISSSYRLFDRTGLIGARVPWSEELLITGSVLYESRTQGVFWMLGFENKLSDVLRWGIAYRDLSASRDGLLKTYDKNDHAVLDLTYFF
ncbi:MAG TPA: hypothetical protein PKC28_12355, partial [Bdellovibrionales bacterium]|nr:hypothetical protein [Bdellovibrionales bacterium]